nr:hypothetical protein BaRGS_032878 [Batillaria attramentaria]
MPTGVFGYGEEEVTAMLTTVVENNAWGGPSLMLWGAIGHNQVLGPVFFQGLGPGRGNGITAQRVTSPENNNNNNNNNNNKNPTIIDQLKILADLP